MFGEGDARGGLPDERGQIGVVRHELRKALMRQDQPNAQLSNFRDTVLQIGRHQPLKFIKPEVRRIVFVARKRAGGGEELVHDEARDRVRFLGREASLRRQIEDDDLAFLHELKRIEAVDDRAEHATENAAVEERLEPVLRRFENAHGFVAAVRAEDLLPFVAQPFGHGLQERKVILRSWSQEMFTRRR